MNPATVSLSSRPISSGKRILLGVDCSITHAHPVCLARYATGLPHSTIFSVLEYVGFGEDWIAFFRKYLEAPLNLDAASDNRPQLGPRIRKRGVPMAHASEKFTGELVLFFMDLAVNRQTGILLKCLLDDILLC